ncbi:hypothetical protein [Alteromonas sp. R78001]|uniref:hypothetical protein n=1 Tax=Alteromonas sp. R78001 TaxID=3093865 RepID=UPI00366EFED2
MFESGQLFSDFLTLGKKISYDKEVDLYTYSLDKEKCSCKEYGVLEKALKEINSSCELEEKNEAFVLEFENSNQDWADGYDSYLHKDLSSFIRTCLVQLEVPNKFCIADKKLTDQSSQNPTLLKIISLTNWTKLLNCIADHKQDNNVLVFFSQNESGRSKVYELSPYITTEEFESLDIDEDHTHFEHLLDSWNLKDAHEKDRKSVMIVSFSEVMGQIPPSHNPFKYFLSQAGKFHDRYRDNYDIYVNRFSVDTQLREIDEQHLEFIGKLQDLVTSAQTKAFAMPGVMVAIGALAKLSNYLGVISIFIGVVMTKILINKSNELLRENLQHFSDTVSRALGQYVKYRNEAEEVRAHAEEANKKLTVQIQKAQQRVTFLDALADWMLVLCVSIIIAVLYSIYQS